MTELKITQADIDRAHEWMRGQPTGLRMMLTKPRGIYEMLAAHRIAAEEGKAELVEALGKVMPIHVSNGPDYAEVVFSDGTKHATQAMTMHPQDWLDIAAALARVRGEG